MPEGGGNRGLEQVAQHGRERRVDLHVLAQHRDHVRPAAAGGWSSAHVERAHVDHGIGDRDHQRLAQEHLRTLLVEQARWPYETVGLPEISASALAGPEGALGRLVER